MNRIEKFRVKFVEELPYRPENGMLYISMEHCMALHLCPCGCGHEIYIQFHPSQWRLEYDGHVSIRPSIGNFDLPCRSHYFITSDTVEWVIDEMTDKAKHKRQRRKWPHFFSVSRGLKKLFK